MYSCAHPDAAEAAELGAVGAEASVPQLLHADEAAEHFSDALREGDECVRPQRRASGQRGGATAQRHAAVQLHWFISGE